MTAPLSEIIVGDLADLPDGAMGARNLVWWGNIGFMLIEGTAFALAIGVYLYLLSMSPAWPPKGDAMPGLFWSAVFTVTLLASEVLNLWVSRKARQKDARGVRVGTLFMALWGLALVALRGVEFAHLGVRWDHDAYGSVLWMLMILHSSHLITDLGDTVVQSAWLYTHEIQEDQFSDVEDNTEYWSFVVAAWLPIYGLLYWVPRWL